MTSKHTFKGKRAALDENMHKSQLNWNEVNWIWTMMDLVTRFRSLMPDIGQPGKEGQDAAHALLLHAYNGGKEP